MKKQSFLTLITAIAIIISLCSCGNKKTNRIPYSIKNIKVESIGDGCIISFDNIEGAVSATISSKVNGIMYSYTIPSKDERFHILLSKQVCIGEEITIKLHTEFNKSTCMPLGKVIAQSFFKVNEITAENIDGDDYQSFVLNITSVTYDEVSTVFQYTLIKPKTIGSAMKKSYPINIYNGKKELLATTQFNSTLFGQNQLLPISELSYGDIIYITANISGNIYTSPNIAVPK